MKRVLILTIAVCPLILATDLVGQFSASSGRAVPRLVRFSGTLRPEGAKPAHGVVDLSFSLFKEESGGEPLWFESQTVEVDAQGRYNVLLGAMHPDGLPMDLFTSGEARWLSIMVGKSEQPRALLVSVPYALKAADAESLGGKPATAFVATEQLKEQVATALSDSKITQRSLNTAVLASTGGGGTPAFTDTNPSTLTCNVATDCLVITQNSGAHALISQMLATSGAFVGVYGLSASTAGRGVFGQATATSGTTYGVRGDSASTSGTGVLGLATSTTGLSFGVRGQAASTSGIAVHGLATSATGLSFGVWGQSNSTGGRGLFGYSTATTGATYGILGTAASTSGTGLQGQALAVTGNTIGLRAETQSPTSIGAVIDNLGGGKLISARSTGFVERFSVAGNGNLTSAGTISGTQLISTIASGTPPLVVASTTFVPNLFVARSALADTATNAVNLGSLPAASFALLSGGNSFTGSQSVAASGVATTALDVQATNLTEANTGVSGRADGPGGVGLYGEANNGVDAIGVWGRSDAGYAGQFDGDVNVTGTLSKAGGSFKIDHPLDPARKYLLHSFVESPDMMNIYNGIATLDANGEAAIEMPEWFEALNQDFRYQLTAIGAPGPNLFIASKIHGNQFRIAGGSPGMEVSWQVTGIRHDAWANAHRIPVEVEKPAREKGSYIHPQLFGAPQQNLPRRRGPNSPEQLP